MYEGIVSPKNGARLRKKNPRPRRACLPQPSRLVQRYQATTAKMGHGKNCQTVDGSTIHLGKKNESETGKRACQKSQPANNPTRSSRANIPPNSTWSGPM